MREILSLRARFPLEDLHDTFCNAFGLLSTILGSIAFLDPEQPPLLQRNVNCSNMQRIVGATVNNMSEEQ